mmetsp:Transcript_13846/g.20426  ORF Transcript_13846/g.20426 Transcript_13846/m.20426 type:complete len:384 (-) Transcript_13846:198-1349(-)|eukprot:CAMPEP_0194205428 /NCGR_PEP_ID=MMETSP0156-20130528/4693_1 /TAXON_ID=33649 /ORGANISM="Thalassionema nitzschioides, Strain L26-B" /LENGTH=383 /DNA_ID=CAMNT_0038931691 /DNA_START=111 /DNA_END=1262 /DNA_ORIENTATION=-
MADSSVIPLSDTAILSDNSNDSSSTIVWIGMSISFTGTFFSALGLALQRLSHKRNNELPLCEQKPAWRQWLNLLGVLALFGGALFALTSYGMAPGSLLNCMAAMTLVFNMILAPALCGEVVFAKDVWVNGIVIVGTVVAVVFGPHREVEFTESELMALFDTVRFAVYFSVLVVILLCMFCLWLVLLYDIDNRQQRQSYCINSSCGLLCCFTKWTPLTRSRLLRISYPVLAGLIGGNTSTYAKAFIELCETTSINGENQFVYGGTYFILLITVLSVTLQLAFLNHGLKRFEALFVVPVYQCCFMLSGIMGSMFYFNEVEQLSALQIGMFSLGVCISTVGILLHSTRRESNVDDALGDLSGLDSLKLKVDDNDEEDVTFHCELNP